MACTMLTDCCVCGSGSGSICHSHVMHSLGSSCILSCSSCSYVNDPVALKFPVDYDFMEANRFPSE